MKKNKISLCVFVCLHQRSKVKKASYEKGSKVKKTLYGKGPRVKIAWSWTYGFQIPLITFEQARIFANQIPASQNFR
jgi:hypothetical protein